MSNDDDFEEKIAAYLRREVPKNFKPVATLGNDQSPDEVRLEILERVGAGIITPEQAEAEWRRYGQGPLAYEPPAEKHDPLKLPAWTLPMTLAWIVTRDIETVMWFHDNFRAEVLEWYSQARGWALVQPAPMTMVLAEMALADDERVGADCASRRQAVHNAKAELKQQLARGSISATAVAAGDAVVQIPAAEWPRLEFCMDLRRDYLAFEHNLQPIYWRLKISASSILETWPERPRAAPSAKGERACQAWLEREVATSPHHKPKPKKQFKENALARFAVSGEGFDRAWANATRGNATWTSAGAPKGHRKSKEQNRGPK